MEHLKFCSFSLLLALNILWITFLKYLREDDKKSGKDCQKKKLICVLPTCFGRGIKLRVTLLIFALSRQIFKEQERDQLLLFQLQPVTCVVLGEDDILVQTQWQEA